MCKVPPQLYWTSPRTYDRLLVTPKGTDAPHAAWNGKFTEAPSGSKVLGQDALSFSQTAEEEEKVNYSSNFQKIISKMATEHLKNNRQTDKLHRQTVTGFTALTGQSVRLIKFN